MDSGSRAQEGDLAQLFGPRGNRMTVLLKPGDRVETMYGVIHHEGIIGTEWGSDVNTHLGKAFTLLQPALDDLLREIERNTQVVYPKEHSFGFLEVSEILHRYYKPIADRLRPVDTMNAHTSFLIFARMLPEETLRRLDANRDSPQNQPSQG